VGATRLTRGKNSLGKKKRKLRSLRWKHLLRLVWTEDGAEGKWMGGVSNRRLKVKTRVLWAKPARRRKDLWGFTDWETLVLM